MPASTRISVVQPNADGTLPISALASLPSQAPEHSASDALVEALQSKVDNLQAVLAKPLSEILSERETALDTAVAWDRFGAMWMLSQRAMRRVALDLAKQLGVSESDVVARAMVHANAVLNDEEQDLGATIAPAQMQHIERHKAFLRKQFR